MVKITESLVRKKAEHNELEIFSLEELSLHQENVEKIEHLDKWCRELKILYLQSNLIPKIENVGRLKKLEYLNLALNNIERIENLEGCESLTKLDLTVNFVGELTSVEVLRENPHFAELYLVGNPCAQYEGYRDYVIATLPNLKSLDGVAVEKSERIKATQDYGVIRARIVQQQLNYKKQREKEREHAKLEDEEEERIQKEKEAEQQKTKPGFDGTWYTDINEEDKEKRAKKEVEDREREFEEDKQFFEEKSAFTPESRIKAHKKIEEIKVRDKKKEEAKNPPKQARRLFADDGRPLNVNESKIDFKLTEDEGCNNYILDYECYKYLDTSLIDVDVQPTYIRIVTKGKIFQLALNEEVNAEKSSCKRSQITGHLLVTMPKAVQIVKPPQPSKQKKIDKNKENEDKRKDSKSPQKLEVDASVRKTVDVCNIYQDKDQRVVPPLGSRPYKKVEERLNSETFVDDPDVPPLE